jgi:Zn-dependent peptidase ImmA (M78 family)
MTSLPINIEQMIRFYGIELNKDADLREGISGQIEAISEEKYRISVQRNDHYFRKRFTMAHELGHFILHKDKIGAGLDDNKMYRAMYRMGDGVSNKEEMEANKYAAKTLMPEDMVMLHMNNGLLRNGRIDEDMLINSAKKFQVSPKSLEIRVNGLKQKFLTN